MVNRPRLRRAPVRVAGAMMVVATAILLLFVSLAIADEPPYSEFPPPPPSPLTPPDWEGPLVPFEGDVNLDGRVTMADVLAIMQHRAGLSVLSESNLAVANTNDDASVTMADALHIMQFRADPDGSLGILSKPLWDWAYDADVRDPLLQNGG